MNDPRTFREGLLCVSGFTSTAILSSSASDDPREGREPLDNLESICIASLFSWELRGSIASLLGTGVEFVSRFAENKELDFVVVSFKQDDGGLASFDAGVRVALEACVGLLELDWVPDLEKKPRILCCFPFDDIVELLGFLVVAGVFAGVGAGALEFSPIVAEGWVN